MGDNLNIKRRLLFTVASNLIKTCTGLFTGFLLAQTLDPSGYGDLLYVLGVFGSIKILVDLGTSNAFYTLICERKQSKRFYACYFGWIIAQFFLIVGLVAIATLFGFFNIIWQGQAIEIVLLALVAVFLQQQVLNAVIQIGESFRKTIEVQAIIAAFTIFYAIGLVFLNIYDLLRTESVLICMILQSCLIVVSLYLVFKRNAIAITDPSLSLNEVAERFKKICAPLIILSVVTFLYDFFDKWMLQNFAGSKQQGYFQVSNQFTGALLLITTSVVNVYWKEISSYFSVGNVAAVQALYIRSTRFFFMLTCAGCALIIPWADQIINHLLGSAYVDALPALTMMLLYPVHLSLGVIGGATLLAIGATADHMRVSIFSMLISLPISFFLLAPSDLWGLDGGAIGLSAKYLLVNIVSTNIQSYIISKRLDLEYSWTYQIYNIGIIVCLGFIAAYITNLLFKQQNQDLYMVVVQFALSSFLFLIMLSTALWKFPMFFGIRRFSITRSAFFFHVSD